MRRDDLTAVLDIERRSFPQPWSQAFFEKELGTPFAHLTVAVDGDVRPRLVGYTCPWRVTDEVHLLNSTGVRAMFLEVRAGNVVARRLYRQLGFRDLGVRRAYYGPGQDAIVMELRLDGR